jgi:hypothetical protein
MTAVTKSLNDIKQDMSELYEELRSGRAELKVASELANIAGKYLKAEQLQLAREVFTAGLGRRITGDDPVPTNGVQLPRIGNDNGIAS